MDPLDSVRIGAIGVVTCNRTSSLVACLQSFLTNCRCHSRTPDIIVADDPSAAESESVRSALKSLGHGSAQDIRYAGRHERSRFADALAKESGVPPDVARFALFGDRRCARSTGANRNGLLLDTIDSLVLNVDDDTRGEVAMAPGAEDELSCFTGYDPTEFWFFPDRTAAVASVSFAEIDILRQHEALLGHAVAECGGPADSPGRVAVTLHGLVGDSGMRSPRYYLTLSGDSRLRLVSSETGYRSAFHSREVLRTVRRPTVSTGPFVMTTFFGLDTRVLLPPFFPVQRNSDGIFGLMLQKTTSHCTGFLPSVLLHAPPPRTFQPDAMWTDADGLQLADVIIDCAFGFDAGAHLPVEARLHRLGRHLRWVGSLGMTEFDAYIRAQQQFRTIAFITALRGQLQAHGGQPHYWAADATRMIERVSTAACASDYTAPRDLVSGEDADASRRLAQELVGRFGELLDAWPAIVAAARTLRARDVRMSTPIRADGER
jgi:hypothetical protein